MNIISPSADFDDRLAQLVKHYVVGVTLTSGDMLDMTVMSVGRNEGGFVTLDGPTFDEENPEVPGSHRSIALIDIDTLEVY